ncbi:metal-dependent hydrolase [Dasania marina]|uniref:metal-dependent hydrolase n=1 Tax=Dasania marina TaxID=471499 RepID=UPI00036E10F5|nr:metal-dependent hydrolase [Dasania marina]
MDPLSQAVLGAAAAQSIANKKQLAKAAVFGALAGMAADLDVLIKSSSDSLLALEYHRHFSHSLIFIPLGALFCALLLHLLLGRYWQLRFKQSYMWCLLGYATHGLLDACTSYGTQLLWPFSHYRVSWDIISIIDPLFTLPLLVLIALAAASKKRCYCYGALAWATLYFSLGYVQHERALAVAKNLIVDRGQQATFIEVKPSFANLLLWKIIYQADDHYYVAATRLGLSGNTLWPGVSIPRLDIQRDLPWLDTASQQAKDIERFRWFSAGFVALDPTNSYQIIDIRYSMLPNTIAPLWGIRLNPQAAADDYVQFYNAPRKGSARAGTLWKMLVE